MTEAQARAAGRRMRRMQMLAEMAAPDEVITALPLDTYDTWAPGVAYIAGQVVAWNAQLYRCIQGHTSQAEWQPTVAALWRALGVSIENPTAVPEWVQPSGGHDAYNTGDRVRYQDGVWRSVVDANIYPPGVVAGQWEVE